MKKSILFSMVALVSSTFISAQAYEGRTEYDKKKQDAIIIEFSYSPEATEGAFIQKLENMGYKAKEEKGIFNRDKGFIVFKGAIISDISSSPMDYVVNIERKSQKKDDESVLYLIILKNGTNVIADKDADVTRSAKSFLNHLLPDVEAFNLELQINVQQDVVTKAQKKFKTLQDDKENMEKKIKKLEDDIKQNLKDQEETQKDIENQNKALEALRAKRKAGA